MTSLREIVRASSFVIILLIKGVIHDVIRDAKPVGQWRVLVVDSNTVKIIDAICKASDILDEQITVILKIDGNPQPFPDKEAVYFISPSVESVQGLIDHFERQPLYRAAHVYFTSS